MTTEPVTTTTEAPVEANYNPAHIEPVKEIVIPPKPPTPKPQPVGDMPPLKWRKKYLKKRLRQRRK